MSDRPDLLPKSPRVISPLEAGPARIKSARTQIYDAYQEPLDTTINEESYGSINSNGVSPYQLKTYPRGTPTSGTPIDFPDMIKSQANSPQKSTKSQAISHPISPRTNSYFFESRKSPVISKKSNINESSDSIPKPHSPQMDFHPERTGHKSTFQKYNPIPNLNSSPIIRLASRESENSFKKPVLPLPNSNYFPNFQPKALNKPRSSGNFFIPNLSPLTRDPAKRLFSSKVQTPSAGSEHTSPHSNQINPIPNHHPTPTPPRPLNPTVIFFQKISLPHI
jgi:hypothetical protein